MMNVLPSLPLEFDEDDDVFQPRPTFLPTALVSPSSIPFHELNNNNNDNPPDSSSSSDDDDGEFADYPDPSLLDVLSDKSLSKQSLKRLRYWSFLLCVDKKDPNTWMLPYRDGLGRLNRPLLVRCRQILTNPQLLKQLGILLDPATCQHAMRCFEKAWPGQPCELRPNVNTTINDNVIMSTAEVLQQGKDQLQQQQDNSKMKDVKRIQMLPSDAAPPYLLMRLHQRRMAAASSSKPSSSVRSSTAPTTTRSSSTSLSFELRMRAKRKLEQEREAKSKISRQVEQEYTLPAAVVALKEEEEAKDEENDEQQDEENDEEYDPTQQEDDENDASSSSSSSSSEEDNNEEEKDEEEKKEMEEKTQVLEEGEEEEFEDNNNNNAQYRKLLQEDAERSAKSHHRFVENQAEEEEENEDGGMFRKKEDHDSDHDEGDLTVREEDLIGIVDVVPDDIEGDNQVFRLFTEQQELKDQKLETKLSRDLRNHTLVESRKKLHATGLDKAMQEEDSDAETDEEQELAKLLRFEKEAKMQLEAVQASGDSATLSWEQEEEEEEIKRELEQTQLYLKRSISLKRSLSLLSSSSSSAAVPSTSFSSQPLPSLSQQWVEEDEESKQVWDAMNSNSLFSHHPLVRSESLTNSRSKPPSTLLFGKTSLGTNMSKAFVFSKRKMDRNTLDLIVEEEEAARTGFESTTTSSSAVVKKRRVKMTKVSATLDIQSLPSFKLLAPSKLDSGIRSQRGGGESL